MNAKSLTQRHVEGIQPAKQRETMQWTPTRASHHLGQAHQARGVNQIPIKKA